MLRLSYISFLALFAVASTSFAQNPNQAAVDTLTKDVSIAVFSNIKQPKAQEIYSQLLNCGDGCDPQQIIRAVGSWDQVGAKMQELSEVKNTQQFQGMSPGEANAAIRKQLALFYARYKNDKNYGKPLSQAVQTQILAKIDQLLPPGVPTKTAPTASTTPVATQPASDEETDASSPTPSENQKGNTEDKQFWMILISFFAGVLGGAAAVYFLLYRESKAEANRLRFENSQLSRSLDAAQRNRPANVPRQPQDVNRQKADAYDVILGELGGNIDPLEAIRQLKQQTSDPALGNSLPVRSGEPVVEPTSPPEPPARQHQAQPAAVQAMTEPTMAHSDVFYFPPPDPNGLFDMAQKSTTLSPESAYRFAVSADNPSIASFQFEAEPGRVARFLTYRNYMIEPACESENTYSAVYTRIAMRRDGDAVLENGAWRVKTKALIRYE